MSRLLRRVKRDLILATILGVGTIVAYHVLLDEEAKRGLKAMNHTIIDSYHTLSKMVDDRIGTIMDDEVVAQNRLQVKNDWKALGF